MRKYLNIRANIALGLIVAFLVNSLGPLPLAQADEFYLPAVGARVSLSPQYNPPILKGIKVHPDHPFRFDFILDQGDSPQQAQLKTDATRLIKYFLASLTIPEKDLWVNLSPYEKNRIVPASFGQTEMGRDLLAQDYMLKQITASLIYPEDEIGKRFWKRIYEEAYKKFGTTNIPVNTFNKVWIIPDKAVIYENAKAGTAYVVEAKLKVMLEEDYLAFQKQLPLSPSLTKEGASNAISPLFYKEGTKGSSKDINALGSNIVREIVIPELTKEVNEGKNFSQLRQVYSSLILAAWYKKKIKDSILAQVYADKRKIKGLSFQNALVGNPEYIYQQYLKAFKKGVYNYIKEDIDPTTQETIPRKYFSGGFSATQLLVNGTMRSTTNLPTDSKHDLRVTTDFEMANLNLPKSLTKNPAMRSVNEILKKRLFSTPKDLVRFKGTGRPATAPHDGKDLGWLTLTDHVYHFPLPEDINVQQTLALIKNIRGLDLSDKKKIFPQIPDKFIQTAKYLAREYKKAQIKDQQREEIIRTYYALGMILGKETGDVIVPKMSQITQEKDEAESESEIKEWLGLDKEGISDTHQLMERAVELSVQGVRIELESLTFWRGMKLFKRDLQNVSSLALNERVKNAKNKFGTDSREAARAEIRAIDFILNQIRKFPGWVKQTGENGKIFEASPAIMRLTKEMNCIGRSALTALFLQELGINEIKSVVSNEHIFLLVRLSDGRYFWIDPSDRQQMRTQVLSAFPGIDTSRPQGITVDLKKDPAVGDIVTIGPWRQGIVASFYSNLGGVLFDSGDYEGAMGMCQKAIELNPMDTSLYSNLGNILNVLSRYEEAITMYRKAVDLYPDHLEAHFNLGFVLNKMGQKEEAIAQYQIAKNLDPKDGIVWSTLGDVLGEQGRKKEAIEHFQMAIKLFQREIKSDPNDFDSHNSLGEALAKLGFLKEAIKEFQRAKELDPRKSYPYYQLGNLFDDLGRAKEAIENFQKAEILYQEEVRLNPANEDAFFYLGYVLRKLGRKKEALKAFHTALKLFPNLRIPPEIRKFLADHAQSSKNQPADRAMKENGEIELLLQRLLTTNSIDQDLRQQIEAFNKKSITMTSTSSGHMHMKLALNHYVNFFGLSANTVYAVSLSLVDDKVRIIISNETESVVYKVDNYKYNPNRKDRGIFYAHIITHEMPLRKHLPSLEDLNNDLSSPDDAVREKAVEILMKDYNSVTRRIAMRYYYLAKYISEKYAGVPLRLKLDDFIQEAIYAQAVSLSKGKRENLETLKGDLFRSPELHCERVLAKLWGMSVTKVHLLIQELDDVIVNPVGVSNNALWVPDDITREQISVQYSSLWSSSITDIKRSVHMNMNDGLEKKVANIEHGPMRDHTIVNKELISAINTLSESQRAVLSFRFGFEDGLEHTLEETGAKYHLTRERIRQIEAKALRRLRYPERVNRIILALKDSEDLSFSKNHDIPLRGAQDEMGLVAEGEDQVDNDHEGRVDLSVRNKKRLLDRVQEVTSFSKEDKKILPYILQGNSSKQIAAITKRADLDEIERRRKDILGHLRLMFTLGMLEKFGSQRQVQELLIRLFSDLAMKVKVPIPSSHNQELVEVSHEAKKGGIDFTANKVPLQIKMDSRFRGNDAGGGIKFHLDPAMLAQLQNAPGFVPVIINIEPMRDLKRFLEIPEAGLINK